MAKRAKKKVRDMEDTDLGKKKVTLFFGSQTGTPERYLGPVKYLKKDKLEMNGLTFLMVALLVRLQPLFSEVVQISSLKMQKGAFMMIVRRALKNSTIVLGGGAINMELSRYLRVHARTIAGKSWMFINSYAKALEVIDLLVS
ncbi:hypothetical protein ZIOFF_055780 [Zingiber officinale]|uniref:Uncharacterized protein n=1 Tax=Zingiber officinale TaxID=94328 RepID=A0A8J5FGA1_ZINOF|nr:hypothetical protein ZIOFF_055780 [Zingiber officinale]